MIAVKPLPEIELLVVQPTPFCNVDCRYCYLPNRHVKSVLSAQTMVHLFSQVFSSGWARNGLSVVWHAGEPLVLPVSFYRDAFRLIEDLNIAGIPVMHSFQTNGTLIDEAWCAFFREERINLGISVDGPRQFHDRNRVTRSGSGTFEQTIAGVRLLRRNRIPFHVISVLSPASMAAAEDMFDFYVSEGISEVCFNVEESEGAHISSTLATPDVEASFYSFLREFWRLSSNSPGKLTFIREIEDTIRQIIRPDGVRFTNCLVEPFSIISMDWAGNISTFSPELLGLKNAAYGDFILGNINRDRLTDLSRSHILDRMMRDIMAGVEMCRRNCGYFSVCGGGEPVNKLAENGTFASMETAYCRVAKKQPANLVLNALELARQRDGRPGRRTPRTDPFVVTS